MTDEVTYYHASGDSLGLSGNPTITWQDERTVVKQEGNQGVSNDPNKCLRKVTINSYISIAEIVDLNRYMKPNTAMNYQDLTAVSAAILDDGGAFTDDTTDANDAGAEDVKLLPAAPVQNDAFYVGMASPCGGIVFDIGEAGIGTWTITWEYYNGSAWAALTNVDDGTSGFTVGGDGLYVTWTIPSDWTAGSINSQGPFYYVRGRVSAFTNINEDPDGDQIYALGMYPYINITLASGTSMIFPCLMQKPTITKSNDSNYSINVTFEERTI